MELKSSSITTVVYTQIAMEKKSSGPSNEARMSRTSTGVAGTPGDTNNRQFLSSELGGLRSLQVTSGQEVYGTLAINPSNGGYETRRVVQGNSLTSGGELTRAGDPEPLKVSFDETAIQANWAAYVAKRNEILGIGTNPVNPGHVVQTMTGNGVSSTQVILGDKNYDNSKQ